jgi:DNA modification methylase
MRELTVEIRPTESIKPNPLNARTHPTRQVNQIEKSITTFDFTNPLLVDEEGVIIAGHGRLAAAKNLALPNVPVIVIKGLNRTQKRQLMLADNKIAENARWDRGKLAVRLQELVLEGSDITLTGFEIAEADQLILDHVAGEEDPLDHFPLPRPSKVITIRGDVWQLGPHRVVCGDVRSSADVDMLCGSFDCAMLHTDPPYNLKLAGLVGRGKRKHEEFAMASGEMSDAEFADFLRAFLEQAARHSKDGSLHFIFMDWRHIDTLLQVGRSVYQQFVNLVVWVKTNSGQGSFYRSQHELIVVFRAGTGAHLNNIELGRFGRNRSNVWQFAGVNSFGKGRLDLLAAHPTSKPVGLLIEAIKDCTKRGDYVLDLFGGSGSTLLACEKVGRRGLLLEIEPRFVDLTIRRWQDFTGKDAIHIGSGKTFDDITDIKGADEIGGQSDG